MASVYRSANKRAAYAASEQPEFRAAAAEVFTNIKAAAEAHSRSGDFERSISMEKGRIDYTISSDDPNAWSIEFGHVAKDGRIVRGLGIFSGYGR